MYVCDGVCFNRVGDSVFVLCFGIIKNLVFTFKICLWCKIVTIFIDLYRTRLYKKRKM